MIVPKRGFKRKYAYGGSGKFDSITNLLMRIFTSSAAKELATNTAKQLASSAAKVGSK